MMTNGGSTPGMAMAPQGGKISLNLVVVGLTLIDLADFRLFIGDTDLSSDIWLVQFRCHYEKNIKSENPAIRY